MDVPMPAIYRLETSNLPIGNVLLEFPVKHIKNLCKRFTYNYLIRDFSVGTIQILAGTRLYRIRGHVWIDQLDPERRS